MQWKPNRRNSGEQLECDGFTISYAKHITPGLRGIEFPQGGETALIDERGGKRGDMLILNGDWRKEYEEIADQGYDACKAFYESKKAEHRSSWSEDDDPDFEVTPEEVSIILRAAAGAHD